MLNSFVSNVVIGLVTGLVTSFAVYKFTKRKERKQEAFNYWLHYLFDTYKYCEMYIPSEQLPYMWVMKNNPEWKAAIQNIQDAIQEKSFPEFRRNRELTDEEIELSDNINAALKLLLQWSSK